MGNVSILPEGGRHIYLGAMTGKQTTGGERHDVLGGQATLGIDLVRLNLGDDEFGTRIHIAPEVSFAGAAAFQDHSDYKGFNTAFRYGGAIGISGGNDALRLEAIGGAEKRETTAAYVGGRLSLGAMPMMGTTGGFFVQGDTTVGGGRTGDWAVSAGIVARF